MQNDRNPRRWKIVAAASVVLFAGSIAASVARGAIASADAAQPHMVSAKEHLRAARDFLEKAEHNKGGHREEAKRLTDEAIKETEEGIKFAE